jgi:hypothetical protein
LPDSTTNLAASQGYFAFTIRPLNNLADFTTIYNEAGIYFDLNPPILTNTTKLIYVSDLSILEMSTEGTDVQPLNVYPNPSSGIFHLDVVTAMKDIEVYDMLGQRIYFNTTNNYIDLSGKPEGIYCVVLKNEGSKFIGRLVVDR